MRTSGVLSLIGVTAMLVSFGAQQANSLTQEQAIENCRNSVGRPIVQACMRGGGGSLDACREQARPKVRACVISVLNAANGRRNVPVALPKEQAPSEDIAKQAGQLPTSFVAPPRTISDITAILDSEKPDPALIAKLKAEADAGEPRAGSREDLARFYYARGNARAQLGRLNEAIADAEKSIAVSQGAIDANLRGRLEQFLGLQYSAAGDPKKALEVFQRQVRITNAPGAKGYLFNAYRQIAQILLQMGDLPQAEAYLRRSLALIQEARTSGLPGWRQSYATRGQSWESDVEALRAAIFEARGQYREAEQSYRLAELRKRASVKGIMSSPNAPPETQIHAAADVMVIGQARIKAKQGRLAEAEVDARRALLARLKDQGKYNVTTPRYMSGLINALVEQGRYAEAETAACGWPSRSTARWAWPRIRSLPRNCCRGWEQSWEFKASIRRQRRSTPSSTRPSPDGTRHGAKPSISTAGASFRFTPPARSTAALLRRRRCSSAALAASAKMPTTPRWRAALWQSDT